MTQSTFVLIVKMLCYASLGATAPLISGLGQWVDTGEWPPTINWVVIGAGCVAGVATQVLAFFSQSYGTWKEERTNGNGKTNGIS